ncbi:uncharacterized protein LOC124897838 [Capsicum annuum]|uniref:uncharacterized protein LOC124897838 n=1 Tax=Capsicum annuum TaxID=4072 RepID=UPI001FB155A9|nr:uncharacterized protein LOC124897838 [Capsicum annuum]
MYKGLEGAVLQGEIDPSSHGKRVILSSSFTGCARYMIQNYQDAMAICKWAGYPDLFITFTCNPRRPEIIRFLKSRGLQLEDRPEILSRVFKIKLDRLIKDFKEKQIFGRVKSAEILDELTDPHYYKAVEKFMIHGPCGLSRKTSPCMQNCRCSKNFPKKYVENTTIDEDGYPVYKRREDGRTIKREDIHLDNRYVVPHNRYLSLKYGAHINVEWCNQAKSIKYIFKYINKRNDCVTAAFTQSVHDKDSVHIDEIDMYYVCRYISPCEATWRIYGFPIHHREPVIFSDSDPIDFVVNKSSLRESQFLSLFEANKSNEEARQLTYAEFPLKFVWNKKSKEWKERNNSAFSIDRIFFVPPGSGELYYLRMLLNIIKGPKCYEYLRTVNNIVHLIFRDACYALGLLDDDKEYVDVIKEASNWGMPSYLRQLFSMLLLSNSMSRPEFVWEATSMLLSEDILHEVQRVMDNPAKRSKGDIILTVTSSGIASLLLSGGRTVHSRFAIPLNANEDSTCNIKQGSPLASLIVKMKLIIWDEAPMMHRYCFEALDKTLRDILRFEDISNLDRPFGGKTGVLGGDFRQILPVITKDWIFAVGDGIIGNSVDGIRKVSIPDNLLISDCEDPITAIVNKKKRGILAPTLDMVESINEHMVSLNQSEGTTFFSSDTICISEDTCTGLEQLHTPEFLNTIKCSGIPNHAITLKVGVPVMLLRNIDQSSGLCNGTRLIITRIGNWVIEAKVLSENMIGQKVFIPRMSLTPSDLRISFKFQRRQFSIVVSFAMTINKSQGQSLSHVGLYLKKAVFTHGQLYVALSRVTRRQGLKILTYDDEGEVSNEATNVVFKEVYPNLSVN